MRIAVDAMGGDHAPGEIVKGALLAAQEGIGEIILVGDRAAIEKVWERPPHHLPVEIVHTDQSVSMEEAPALALRRKREASILLATRLVKEGRADAVVSAGSTGAQMAAALLVLGRCGKIQRPAIATPIPTLKGPKVLIDAGANVDCRPHNLYEFAHMGSLYADKILGIKNPRVGLLNVGSEPTKGNETTLAAYSLLKTAPLNFIGNVEGREVFSGEVDVIVCDGFVGNVLLKSGEGLAQAFFTMITQEIRKSLMAQVGALLLLPTLKRLKKQVDYTEYGGAPLLGVKGISIVCHGSSNAQAIKNAIRTAARCVEQGLVQALSEWPGAEGVSSCPC